MRYTYNVLLYRDRVTDERTIYAYAAVCLACAVTSPMTHENCPRPLCPMPDERFHHAGTVRHETSQTRPRDELLVSSCPQPVRSVA